MLAKRVVLNTDVVSQLDGARGYFDGYDRGLVRVKVDGFQNAILFSAHEVLEEDQARR